VEFMDTCLANNMTEAAPHLLTAAKYAYVGATNKNLADKYEGGYVISDMWNHPENYTDKLGDVSTMTLSQLKSKIMSFAVSDYGIRSVYQANSAVSQHDAMDTRSLALSTVALDNIWCIGACPNEMFHQNSIDYEKSVLASGKYKMAMTFGYTNGTDGYLPSLPVWDYTSYETDVTKYAAGTGEKVAEAFCNMLGVEYTQTAKEEWK